MIELKITADTPAAFKAQLAALTVAVGITSNQIAGVFDEAARSEAEAPEKPKATRSTKAKTEPAKQDTPADGPSSGEEASSEAGPTATTDASPSDTPLEAVPDEANLRKRATQYAAKAGPTALVEMQKAAGAPNGKMSEIVTDPESMKKLDILLADAGY